MARSIAKQHKISAAELKRLDAKARAREREAHEADRSIKMPSFVDGASPRVRVGWHGRV